MTEDKKQHRYCVVMCGGVGSRFWPFSRNSRPKQFLDFFGTGKSLLQLTVERILPLIPAENIILVSNKDYVDIIREQLPYIKETNILAEPARRNTAPCICWAAHHIQALDPEALIVTLPSDHLILKEQTFREVIAEGFDFVASGDNLLTIGLYPTSPNTGYGYIQIGHPLDKYPGINKVKTFTEKPDIEMARLFVKSGEFFWNSGMFLWSVKSILKGFADYAPDMAKIFNSGKGAYGTPQESMFIKAAFPEASSISIDYAIMEKARNVYVKTTDIGWSDLGAWKALYDTSPKNRNGNVSQGCNVIETDSKNSVFAVEGDKIVVASGLDGYIVADTPNALLIYPLRDEQKIKQVVNDIREHFGDRYL